VEVARFRGGLAELASQPGQVHVDGLVGTAQGLLPDLGQQLAAADHLARPTRQVREQVELEAGEIELVAAEGRDTPAGVDVQSADRSVPFS
jgi:hypothetical protein